MRNVWHEADRAPDRAISAKVYLLLDPNPPSSRAISGENKRIAMPRRCYATQTNPTMAPEQVHIASWASLLSEVSMSITRVNTFRAKDGMANSLREFLISIIPLIEQSRGCESCQLLRSQDNANEFVVIEVWASVTAHQASVKNIPPEKFGVVMPMLVSPPSGSYYAAA